MEKVVIQKEIVAPLSDCFDWFYYSENFLTSPIVFKSDWRSKNKWVTGAQRDIVMIAGWYLEEITAIQKNQAIRYRVNRSFPRVRQDFTEITFSEITENRTNIRWTIEIDVPIPFGKQMANRLAAKIAATLYTTILNAGKRELEQ